MTYFVIANGAGTHFRQWKDFSPGWTDDICAALKFADRQSAEDVARDDEDAWLILEKGEQSATTAWLPISAAPLDGTKILVGRAGYLVQMASWQPDLPAYQWPTLSPAGRAPFEKPTHFALVSQVPAV